MKNVLTVMFLITLAASCTSPNQQSEPAAAPEPVEARGVEFGDAALISIAQKGLDAMTAQDLDGFTAEFTNDAVYQFNSGDTLAGIEQIREYWGGRMEVIESISFSNEIFLPLKVTQYQNAGPGDWVLAWFDTSATYTSGGSMSQSIHTAYHFTSDKKIDRIIQWLDRVPIMEAQESGGTTE